ncbi:unnamed protein product, partial [Didymodactylos carnosus]
NPLLWLEVASKIKANVTGSPNFGLDLCVKKYDTKRTEKLELSSIRYLIC